ncbi:MAG TPA: ABC transporter permease [Terracidiphilus sp.]|nr:ABC transporter permease [Terracidiphilus sp.]
MTPLAFSLVHRALLYVAALMTPAGMRAEWLREWQAETWHVERSCAKRWCAMAFCLGAFKDAWSLRQHARREKIKTIALHGSAGQCLLAMATVLAASCLLAHLLPEARSALSPPLAPARTGLILIQRTADTRVRNAAIPFAQFLTWSGSRQQYFDELAFYRTSRENVLDGGELKGGWKIAYATANFFELLGIPVWLRSDNTPDDGMSAAIVSDGMWRRAFGADPDIAGRVLNVGGRQARVIGVASSRAWKLPGHVDAWVLEPESAMPAHASGNVVAHLTSAGRAEMWAGSMHITAYGRNNAEIDLNGSSIDDEPAGPWDLFKFALFLALVALPAITTVSMGEYSPASHRPPWPRRVVRWLFLAAKIGMLLPMVYYASLDLAYWRTFSSPYMADYIQLISAFVICLAGMRWVLLDQRQRCPVCLRRVAHPARVGLASRTFLAWNGTELMCEGGHTLLHVPGLETSWFAAPRWMYLDASWEFLFAGSDAG